MIQAERSKTHARRTRQERHSALRNLAQMPSAGVRFLEARHPDVQAELDPRGHGAVTLRDLFKATLRVRSDRLVGGEIRGGEALELVQAMTPGHGGCMSTVHATFPADTLSRLETMASMSSVALQPTGSIPAAAESVLGLGVELPRSSYRAAQNYRDRP
jgi:pilus assembly protein CpaF